MITTVLEFTVGFLLFISALTLFLVLRLATRVATLEASIPAAGPEIGTVLPTFEGRRNSDGALVTSDDLAGKNTVLVFMSSGCPQCVAKRPDLLAMLPGMKRSGVTFWIVSADDRHGVSAVVGDSALETHVLHLEADGRRRLNPNNLIPSYIFIDEQGVVRDHSHMEDENWVDFVRQMKADASGTVEAG
ncbi:redoxin family protein [uncultured Brevundimonas sp.]|uniref:peroxiredoxin family protein n=1 Tax=uncultured Brevundimonas sp. TaxID=213418 RepID=UPI0030ECF386|tara:strand:- start:6058 stop:6624 length:567 start_codon:yes stop_codon:yes gene_type:complete